MLNELCQLADSLEKAGISPKEWHSQLKPLPNASDKKPCYRISIAEDGAVNSVDTLNAEQVAVLRKWEPSNGSSFPGFNIQPLYRITDEDQKKLIKTWREGKKAVDLPLLKSWCAEENDNWDRKIKAKLGKCLHDVPGELSKLTKTGIPNTAIALLMERATKYPHENTSSANPYAQGFRAALEKYLWAAIENGESAKIMVPVLVLEGSAEKKPDKDRGSISVFLDILDWQEYRVSSRESIEAVNDCLVNGCQATGASGSVDAFGISLDGHDDKLPSIKMPIIADVKLRAMNSESSCQLRYKSIDSASFPVGYESRKRAKGALEWLGDPAREGETWGRADSKELIFVYPNFLPQVQLKLAACFGSQKNIDNEARFANAAQDVIQGLNGMARDLNALELRVFSLKKMDKARTKVVFHRNYTAQRLIDAAREWEEGCANIPDINIRAWGDKKGEWIVAGPVIPFPLQVAQCLNRVWKLDGTSECEIPAIARSQGIELLLDERPSRFVPHLLSVLLQNGKGLLLSLGNALHRGEIVSMSGLERQRLLVPSIIGLLLNKLGVNKENYMNNAPFLVGRMLKLADELHALYCREVRDNNLPPLLIGNSLMTAALDSPNQALAQLALRLKPYYGWAQTFKGNEKGNLAAYFIRLYGDVATQLAQIELPARFNDSERAQLLLGYLAANPKQSETTASATTNQKGE